MFEELSISLIQVYAPTENSSEDELNRFYQDLDRAYSLTEDKIIIVMGDFNARIGRPGSDEHLIMGEYGYGERNQRGENLIDYALEHKLSIVNTFFKKRNTRKWTWMSPDNKTKHELDYITTNNPKLFTNFEVINTSFPSDHKLLRGTIKLKLPPTSRKNFNNTQYTPKTEEQTDKYINNLKFNMKKAEEELNGPIDVQTYYNKLEEIISSSSEISKCTEKKEHRIFSEHTEQLIKRRSELIQTKNKNTDLKQELGRIYKETSKSIRRDYQAHRQLVITRNLNKYRSTKRAFKELSLHKTWIQKLQQQSKETKSRQDIIEHATDFYKELYRKRDVDRRPEQMDTEQIEPTCSSVHPIEKKEVYEHIKRLKNEKSPGPDGLSNEVLKIGAPILIPHLTKLFNMVIDTETVPSQWCKSDIILIFKKGDPLDIGNYRPISLLASVYKLFSSIMLKRITTDIDNSQPVEQAGFRSGYSTTDHIQSIEQVIQKYREFNRPLYVAFIDYSKAFDSISHNSIWNALNLVGTHAKYVNTLKNIYENSQSKVKLETRGKPINIERGVRQGDPLSPKLFIAVLENIFRNIDWSQKGIKICGRHLTHLRFADDIVLLAEKPKELEHMMQLLDQESAKIGLEMNASKTKIMTNSDKEPIKVRGKVMDYVESYIYLGKQISFSKTSNEEEIARRVAIAWNRFWSLKEILKGDYSLTMKKIVMDTCVLPSILYGCQTWTFTEKTKHKILTTQRAMERSILKIRKIQKIRSDTIRQKTKLTDALTHALRLKWNWAGHVSRYTDRRWTIEATRWKRPLLGKRKVGRPIKRWADDIRKVAGKRWMIRAKDRKAWKELEEAFTQTGVHIQKNN